MKYLFVQSSQNRKTGPIPQTYTERASCPASCAHYRTTCYAEDFYTRMAWKRTSADISGLVAAINRLPKGQLWRHNVAGDLSGIGESVDPVELGQIVAANRHRKGFTYTHKPLVGSPHAAANLAAVRAANADGFTVNASANNLAHADTLAALGGVPVVVVVPSNAPDTLATPTGRKVVVCPAQRRDDVTCASCRLCSRGDRSVIVAFRAHGASYRRAEAATVAA